MILSTEKRVNEKQKQYRDELPQKLNLFTSPDVNTREVGRTRDKRRKPFYISFIK